MVRYRAILATSICAFGFTVTASEPRYTSHATTAGGRVISVPPHAHRPWGHDIIHDVRPEFPPRLRERHLKAETRVRVILDVASGKVRDVVVLESSGYPDYDANVIRAVRQWRARPAKWREFDVYVGASAATPSKP
jgi:TonB family protein